MDTNPTPTNWLLDSQLAPHIDAYTDFLKRGGHATTTLNRYMLYLAHLGCDVEELDEAAVSRFLDEHLPGCDCPEPVCRNRRDLMLPAVTYCVFCAARTSLPNRRPRSAR